jgi:NAD(P)-dependent dehydrogenase (short-subunit alcohol dehydrogenase family)
VSSTLEFSDHVVVVTGAAGGIGLRIAQRLAEQGGRVALVDVDEKGLNAACDGWANDQVLPVVADVTDRAAMEVACERIAEHFGGIHLAVANAGVGPSGTLQDTTASEWDRAVAVNLTGAFNTIRGCAPALKRSSGRRSVVMMSSVLALRGAGNMVAYSAAKAGVAGLVRAASQDLAPFAITVNGIAPGPIRTPLLDAIAGDTLRELESTVPLRRLGTPDDIASTVMFLASPASSFITGQVFAVDGGLSTRAYWRDAS